jgi:L-alanine-DL-glutamate epimerase-like enolase superfamily enzyme
MSAHSARIARLTFRELHIPFKVTFRHASAERAETETIWVEAVAANNVRGIGEACPRRYVTGETLSSAAQFVRDHDQSLRAITDVSSLHAWMIDHEDAIDRNPAAWCAVELAVLDLLGKQQALPVEALLCLPQLEGRFTYTAVLGDAAPAAFHAMAEQYLKAGFNDFKVKLSGAVERDREKLAFFERTPLRVRADANNLWPDADAAIEALSRIAFPFFAVEEPIPANRYDDLFQIGCTCGCRIVLDESIIRREQLASLPSPGSLWIVNARVSKMGGLIRSLQVVEAARKRGIGVVVGAQVGETSLLTRAALPVAKAAGDLLVAQEGAFGTFLLERDPCEPSLMFGPRGVLDVTEHAFGSVPGFGLSTTF